MPEEKELTAEEIEERTRKKLEDDEKEHQKVREALDAENKKVADEEKAKAEREKAKKEKAEAEAKKPAAAQGGHAAPSSRK
jgi:hypothetical protein